MISFIHHLLNCQVIFALLATMVLIDSEPAQAQVAPDFAILSVQNAGKDTSEAWFVAISNNGLLSYTWNDHVKSIIKDEPFILYHKGNPIGSFRITHIVEDELGIWFDGVPNFDEGINPLALDSLGQCLFTAVSANHRLPKHCIQPTGYSPENFSLDFDCDGKADSLQTKVLDFSGTVDLKLGNGTNEHIDSVLNSNGLESIWIQDVIDLDSDGIQEVLATINTYPTYWYVIYKQTQGTWKRILHTRGLGD